jgi:hypothetical protein
VLLLAIIGERRGVHLPELYGTLREHPHWAGRTDDALRELVDELGVPVRAQVRVGTVGGRRGIHRADVEPLLTGMPIPPPPPGSPLAYIYTPGRSGVEHRVERRRRTGEGRRHSCAE